MSKLYGLFSKLLLTQSYNKFANAGAAKLITGLTLSLATTYTLQNSLSALSADCESLNFVTNINSQGSVKYLLSQLRDKDTKTAAFRFYSDRIMRLLVEQAISQEPMRITKRKAPTQDEFDHFELAHKPEEYCAITIIRAGDSMVQEVIDLLPGITVGKVLI